MQIPFSPIEPKFLQFEQLMTQSAAMNNIANNQRYTSAGEIIRLDRSAKADTARFNEFALQMVTENPNFLDDYSNAYCPLVTRLRNAA